MPQRTAAPLSNSAVGVCASTLPKQLPDDPTALKALLLAQQRAFEAREAERQAAFDAREAELHKAFEARILEIYEQLRLARRRMFGPSGESHAGQGWLFDEAEALVASAPEAGDTAALPPPVTETSDDTPADTGKKKARGKRKPLPLEFPRIDVIHDVPEAERTCACGTPMVEIGQDVSEQLDIVPMQVRVLRHIRKRYGCPKGDQAPVTAPAPAQVLPKSNASNDLLAMLLVTKYVDSLPLARFEYVLARAGVLVPRQTLARWVIGTAQALQPIANLILSTVIWAMGLTGFIARDMNAAERVLLLLSGASAMVTATGSTVWIAGMTVSILYVVFHIATARKWRERRSAAFPTAH